MVSTLRELNERGVVRAPRHAVTQTASIPRWRWLALLAMAGAVLHERHVGGAAAMSDLLEGSGAALFPMASWFGLWQVALVALLGYTLFQLGEEQRRISVYDLASRHVVALALLASLSLVTLPRGDIYVTASIALVTAVVAWLAYHQVHGEISAGRAAAWVGVPFALAFGSSLVVSVMAIETAITVAGCPSTAPAIAATIALAAVSIKLCMRFREPVLAGIVGWTLMAICAANRSPASLAGVVFLTGTACTASAIAMAGARFLGRPATQPTSRRTTVVRR